MLNQEQLAFLAEILLCWKAMDREHQRLLERTMTERSVKRGEYLYQGDRDCTGSGTGRTAAEKSGNLHCYE